MTDRTKFIGGSDAAAILGISPWATPLDLYLEKIGQTQSNADNVSTRRGKRLEPYICDMLEAEHGWQIACRRQRYFDPALSFLSAEIDAETRQGENVEIKTVHPFKVREWGDELTDSIPVHYTAQAMHGLMVTGRDVCKFAVLIGDELRLYNVTRDVEVINALRERETEFWMQNVLAQVPPDPVTLRDAVKLFRKDAGTEIEANPKALTWAMVAQQARAQIEEQERILAEATLELKAYMGENAVLTGLAGEVIATWKNQTSRRLDQSALGAAHPEILEQFKRASETRVFRLK